jgi:hypothetical protein
MNFSYCNSLSGLGGKVVLPDSGQNISLNVTDYGLVVKLNGVTKGSLMFV